MSSDGTKPPTDDISAYQTIQRKIFGSSEKPTSDGKPAAVPPPPPGAGEYPKKPKYWQLRGTEHTRSLNRIAFWSTMAMVGVSGLIYLFNDLPNRANKRFNQPIDVKQRKLIIQEKWKTNDVFFQVMLGNINVDIEPSGKLRKPKRKELRWDIQEVDRRICHNAKMNKYRKFE